MSGKRAVALYTTVYPGVERFLPDWYASVEAQTDRDFDLWIGVDGMSLEQITEALGADPEATWVFGEPGDGPVRVRERAIERIVDAYDAVVFVDSDDILRPDRVSAARQGLADSDVYGCALRLADESGADLGIGFGAPEDEPIPDLLALRNIFGMSNTAYRTATLKRCLPLPKDAILLDWYMATLAWAHGARFVFDSTARMDYRQHGANIASVRPPFTEEQIMAATRRVLAHYDLVLARLAGEASEVTSALEKARRDVDAFASATFHSPLLLREYVMQLNRIESPHVWWSCVAHPVLEDLWRS